ncbi:hypothetical protein BCR36DRAFT_332808 [Piromyces finnis]|uniref:Uncharacterized protein n=1 Tax=Piromyces finnis TaxID=1754191 RepID=A0A1Y1V2K4_9FUNG|nr:hypothetical protein BCR36DRAFT_332808 [Piromyces finnis]|eukprot:ORX45802.1 hypothetical protein BCR36DRAFT_332808 [Piromyces finnis]
MNNSSLHTKLQKILFLRRNKVIIDVDDKANINKIYENAVEKHISRTKELKDHCKIEQCDKFSVTIKVDNTLIEFTNKEDYSFLDKNKSIKDLSIDFEKLHTIMIKETKKIKRRMTLALTLNEEMKNYGYHMDEKLFNIVACLSKEKVKGLYDFIIPTLKENVGSHNKSYRPKFPNFPIDIIEVKYCTNIIDDIVYYWLRETNVQNVNLVRKHEPIDVVYKNVTIGKEEDLHEIMKNLMSAAESISQKDIQDIKYYFTYYEKYMDTLPESFPNKENLAIIINLVLTNNKDLPIERIIPYFKTVTDVLRLVAVMSGKSATLEKKEVLVSNFNCNKMKKFKSFSNKERRMIMALLNNCQNRVEDFHKHKILWERVCERIHPKSFSKFYPDLVDDMVGSYKYVRVKKDIQKKSNTIRTIKDLYISYKRCPRIISLYDNMAINKTIEEAKQLDLGEEVNKNLDLVYNNHSLLCKNKFDIDSLNEIQKEYHVKLSELNEKIKNYKETHPFQGYMYRVNNLLDKKKYDQALTLLAQRPGIFARKLDELLVKIGDHKKTLEIFEQIASKVSVKVLLSLKGYFQKRSEKLRLRVFLIKGTTPKMYIKNRVKGKLDLELCEKICNICDMALMNHFENKPKMNNVYISEDLKKQVIPLDVRSSNSTLETYIKGSRFDISYKKLTDEELENIIEENNYKISVYRNKIDEINHKKQEWNDQLNSIRESANEFEKYCIAENIKSLDRDIEMFNQKIENSLEYIEIHKNNIKKETLNKIRLFIWWTNTKTRIIDIDLSIIIYNENLVDLGHVSFNNLSNSRFKIYHSGDFINGGDVNGNGAAEFIDFDPKQVFICGARYIAVSVISYSGVKFKNLENCKFGWMERSDLNSNEFFEPKTVKQKLDLNSNSTSTIPVIFDCKTNEFIWVDTPLTKDGSCVRIENTKRLMNGIFYYYINPLKDSLYNLIKLHVQSRNGNLVKSVNELSEGDIAFVSYLPYKCIDGVKYIRPVDLDIILSEYMTSSNE